MTTILSHGMTFVYRCTQFDAYICSKDISELVDIKKYKERNFHKISDSIISDKDIEILWSKCKNEYVQMILILIYTGVHINEFINIKKEDIYLTERYIKIVGPNDKLLRIVPISNKIIPFIQVRLNKQLNEYGIM